MPTSNPNNPVTPEMGKQLLQKWGPKITQKRDIKPSSDWNSLSVLGSGNNGTAFDLGNGQVIKLTVDLSEAKAANKLLAVGSPKFAVEFYDVFQLDHTGVYAIIQEKLEPLGDDEMELDVALTNLNMKSSIAKYGYDIDKYKDAIMSYHYDNPSKSTIRLVSALQYIEENGLFEIARGLKQNGIEFRDYHKNNFLKRGEQIVVIDLGISKINGGKDPDIIEKKKLVEEAVGSYWRKFLYRQ